MYHPFPLHYLHLAILCNFWEWDWGLVLGWAWGWDLKSELKWKPILKCLRASRPFLSTGFFIAECGAANADGLLGSFGQTQDSGHSPGNRGAGIVTCLYALMLMLLEKTWYLLLYKIRKTKNASEEINHPVLETILSSKIYNGQWPFQTGTTASRWA